MSASNALSAAGMSRRASAPRLLGGLVFEALRDADAFFFMTILLRLPLHVLLHLLQYIDQSVDASLGQTALVDLEIDQQSLFVIRNVAGDGSALAEIERCFFVRHDVESEGSVDFGI
jgi:hypothetical protein